VGAVPHQGTLAERQRVAARQAPRSVCERQDRDHRSRAEVGRIESHNRRRRCDQDLAEQPDGVDKKTDAGGSPRSGERRAKEVR
jgi:hypothetical protein